MKPRQAALIVVLGLVSLVSAGACEMSFRIVDPTGASREVSPGREIPLAAGVTYRLQVRFVEDHGNCKVGAEETEFLFDRSLVLLGEPVWRDRSSRAHETELVFRPASAGTWDLEVVRDCSKAGYDEVLRFKVM